MDVNIKVNPDPKVDLAPGGLADHLARNAAAFPDRAAVIHPEPGAREPDGRPRYRTVSYGELQRSVEDLAHGLARAGITRGTRTVLMAPPGPELFALAFALFRLGAVPVVVDPGMGLRRMLHCYRAVGAEAFIGPPLAHLVRVLGRRTFAAVRIPVTLGRGFLGSLGAHTLARLRALPGPRRAPAPVGGDDLLMIGFTTGSTGPAKGVEYTHRMALSIARQIEAAHGRTRDDTSLVTLPFYGLLDLVYGSTLVLAPLAPAKVAQADPALLVDALERFAVTTVFASPALLRNLADHLTARDGEHPLPDLRCVVSGGAPVPDAVVARLRAVLDEKARVHVTYGATEVLPITSIESEDILGERAARSAEGAGTCVGRPVPGTLVRIAPVTDGPLPRLLPGTPSLPAGRVGEILVAGESVSPRYHGDPRADALHKTYEDPPGGVGATRVWHRTGDLGYLDADGHLWFCGRKAQRVRTDGQDLHTVRCEGVFNAHPLVRRTALVGVRTGTEPFGPRRPVICVETAHPLDTAAWQALTAELRVLAAAHAPTEPIEEFLRHPAFPVDIRHNAKIGREELSRWAERQLAPHQATFARAARLVPLAGWAYLLGGAVWAATAGAPDIPLLHWLWWADAVLSTVGHAVQIPLALPRARAAGHGRAATIALTMLYGATWWRSL
ncbi:fatty acid CoA ligase family protein (plasmid) [Streptomyces sp. NBC_00536]|uniref:fatty acid CoA ligase family protein n=1 Tax=Streptomyces sp. NBC_00536 TaxID=2975769 RepID=UPI002E813B24|nr:fatty acid CoA ligase family protein [Streptomyces sp. NBC_00536]WUC84132.1 fatty acid CoA ligase family protein [Streptomyces sp. NBC_00536]